MSACWTGEGGRLVNMQRELERTWVFWALRICWAGEGG